MSRGRFQYALVAEASVAGLLFPVCLVAGYLLGKWIGTAFQAGLAPAYIGAALGAVAGFWNLYRLGRKMDSSEHGE